MDIYTDRVYPPYFVGVGGKIINFTIKKVGRKILRNEFNSILTSQPRHLEGKNESTKI